MRTIKAMTVGAALALIGSTAQAQTFTVVGDILANGGWNPATTVVDPNDASSLKVGVTHPGLGNAAILFRARSAGPTQVTDRITIEVEAPAGQVVKSVTAKIEGTSYIARMGDTGASLLLEANDETDASQVNIGVIGNKPWSREMTVYPDAESATVKLYASLFAACSINSCTAQNTIVKATITVETQ